MLSSIGLDVVAKAVQELKSEATHILTEWLHLHLEERETVLDHAY